MAVGNEKRKWQVKFYTKNGKPDHNRRPDQPSPITINRSGTRFLNGVSVVDLFAKFKGTSSNANKSNNTNSNNNNMYDNNTSYADSGSGVESSLEINRRLRYGIDESSRFAYDMQVQFPPTEMASYFIHYGLYHNPILVYCSLLPSRILFIISNHPLSKPTPPHIVTGCRRED